jgi:DNA-binding IclR family transcriptional regulator
VKSKSGSRETVALTEPAVTGAQTLLRALDILECFNEHETSMSLSQVSEHVGLKPPTTHRLLKALASRGMIVSDRGRYALGPGLLRLTATVMRGSSDLTTVAMPAMERLRASSGETVSVHRLLGESRICVGELVSPEPIRMESGVGQVYPLHAGAAGKAILAYLDAGVAERALPAVGPRTITDPAVLRAELDEIRAQGWAVSEGEVVPGAASLAVPLFGQAGVVVGAINVSGPANRWTKARRMRFRDEAIRESEAVSARLQAAGQTADGALA